MNLAYDFEPLPLSEFAYNYYFTNKNGVEYCIIFDNVNDTYFKIEGLKIFEVTIVPNTDKETALKKDDKFFPTLVKIIEDFFDKVALGVALFYLANNSDGKAHVRNRRFQIWHNQLEALNAEILFITRTVTIQHENGEKTHYVGAFIEKKHEKLDLIIEKLNSDNFYNALNEF